MILNVLDLAVPKKDHFRILRVEFMAFLAQEMFLVFSKDDHVSPKLRNTFTSSTFPNINCILGANRAAV